MIGWCLVAGAALAVLSSGASAQPLRGTVRDSVSKQPVAGAVVLLLGQRGDTIARSLTSVSGEYQFALPPDARTPASVRVVRMGFAPRDRSLLARAGSGAPLDLAILRLPTMIHAVNIRAPAKCPRRGDRAVAFGLWEQARAALLASVVARDAVPTSKKRLRFEQLFEGTSDRVLRHAVRSAGGIDIGDSFLAAKTVRDFATAGFSDYDAEGDTRYYGPDADVLLDPAFAENYCLAVARSPRGRRNEIGLAFVPEVRDRVTIDVTGVVWIDTVRRVLSTVEFDYTGLSGAAARAQPGGTLSYREMPTGVILVDQWEFRLVGTAIDTINAEGEIRYTSRVQRSRIGGELAMVHWPDGTTWRASLGEFSGFVLRQGGEPAFGVGIRLEDTDYRSSVDSSGSFAIAELVPGPYRVLIEEPRLASLDLLVPTSFRFDAARDSSHRATLILPTVEELVRDRCMRQVASAAHAKATGFFLGRLFFPDGTPAAEVELRLRAQEAAGGGLVRTLRTKTAADGTFQWCENRLQKGTRLRIEVPLPQGEPLSIEHTLTSHLTVMRIGMP
jgi:hypothetical protein